MTKANKLFKINIIVMLLLALALTTVIFGFSSAKAQTMSAEEAAIEEEADATVEARGVFVKLSLSMSGDGNGNITATVRNDFTLGYSTVRVIVELYSSTKYTNDINEMQLESRAITADLNIYKSISTTAKTNGVMKFWRAQLEYLHDTNPWQTEQTKTILYTADAIAFN